MANLAGGQQSSMEWFGISSCFLLLLFGSECVLATYTAEICGETDYDIYNLRTPSNWTFEWASTEGTGCLGNSSQVINCKFFISFCHPMTCKGSDANACLHTENNGSVPTAEYELAAYNPNENPFKDRHEGGGFYVEFPQGGQYNTSDGKNCSLMLHMTFICNVSYPWIPPNDTKQAVIDKGAIMNLQYDKKCKYAIEFYYAGACSQVVPFPSEDISQLSVGSILVIIFFVVLVTYFGIGMAINCVRGRVWRELLPHNEFWMILPSYIALNVQGHMAINCVRGRVWRELLPHNEFWMILPSYIADGFVLTLSCGRVKNAVKSYDSI